MTSDEVDGMGAGPELDAAVARAMGWEIYPNGIHTVGDRQYPFAFISRGKLMVDYGEGFPVHKPFSTDIAAAWELVEHLSATHHAAIRTPFMKGDPNRAGFTPHGVSGWNGRPDYDAAAETMPLAICRAFLRVKHDHATL